MLDMVLFISLLFEGFLNPSKFGKNIKDIRIDCNTTQIQKIVGEKSGTGMLLCLAGKSPYPGISPFHFI